MTDFTHLHVHTQYSLLDGYSDISKLLKKAKEYAMDSIAITDHGVMYGCFDFLSKCKKEGIKPIIGCEAYIANGSRFTKERTEEASMFHLILLAKNEVGYHNLCHLNYLAFKEGYYYKPRIDMEILAKYHEGLICCSACLGGEIPQLLLNSSIAKAEEKMLEYKEIFGEDYYLEVMNHGLSEQKTVNQELYKFAEKHNIKVVATNDIHFVEKDDFYHQQLLVCLNTGKKYGEQTKMLYTGEEYLKSGDEMATLFAEHPEALANTREIADKIETFEIKRDIILPEFSIPKEFPDEMAYLRHLAYSGAKKRWGEPLSDNLMKRLDYELSVIAKMGFPGYFLIVADFVNYAKNNGILVGPGRGSAAGSAVTYSLNITDVDPIKYGLLFERFLNPDRVSMPDMDIDFEDSGRGKVVKYVIEKYGEDKVAKIVTYGTMGGKSAIKDVARVLDLPLNDSNRLSNLFDDKISDPDDKKKRLTVNKFVQKPDTLPELAKELRSGGLIADVLKHAASMEGSIRNSGVHACGVIISPKPLMSMVPLSVVKNTKDDDLPDMPVVQYEGSTVETAGLLKMDFLGLKNLSIMKNCIKMVKKNSGIEIDIDNLSLDDTKTFELFERGDTVGVFQFESEGMQSNLKELKPTVLEDLIMLNALYRPGPMDYIKNCIDRKHGREKIQYDLPDMEDILKETYGITVYQEQVMLLSQKLADFTGGEADTLRKAMGKKQLDTMQKLQGKFFEGCEKHNYDKKVCQKIWDDWVKFSEYAFNKSHATCYAYIAYQTAYLKANYPKEYMAALLNNEKDNRKIAVLTDDCIRQKINILGPDINESDVDFTATKSGHIRYGLATIKGVGSKELDNLVSEREKNGNFKDLFDFAKRVNLKAFTKKNIELFAKVGAFDSFGIERAVFFCQGRTEGLNFADTLVNFSQQTQDISGETSLFGAADLEIPNPIIPTCEAFSQISKLEAEKELLGTYVSGHPLDAYKLEKEYFAKTNIADFANNLEKFKDKSFNFIAIVSNARHLIAKNGNPWGSFTLQDYSGSIDLRLYTNNYLNFRQFLVDNITMVVNASVRRNFREEYELSINKLTLASEYMNSAVETITLSIPLQKIDKQLIANLDKIIKENKGKTKLRFKIADLEDNISVSLSPKHGLTAKTFALAIKDAYPDLQLSFIS